MDQCSDSSLPSTASFVPHDLPFKLKPVKQCIKASLDAELTGLWCYNSLSFNLFFVVFFSSSFVRLFP